MRTTTKLIYYRRSKPLLKFLQGSYAILVLSAKHPQEIVAAKSESPLVIGIGSNENYCASDVQALLDYTREVYILQDGECARITKDHIELFDQAGFIKDLQTGSILNGIKFK